MSNKVRVGIIGAAGLSAGRLIRILARHQRVTFGPLVSESSPGAPVSSVHPELLGLVPDKFSTLNLNELADCNIVFSCKKHGESFAYVDEVLAGSAKLIDLSGDYRLSSPEVFQHWYGIPHAKPHWLSAGVYGLPELYRDRIRTARLLANPGCYTTTSILAAVPFLRAGYGVSGPITVHAISGVSGAGRAAKAENLFISVAENVRAYRVGNHQHTPEIEQEFQAAVGTPEGPKVLFVPHVGPFRVGIMATVYLALAPGQAEPTNASLEEILRSAYATAPFVRVRSAKDLPQIDHVVGTNYCDIAATYDARTRTIVVISCTDNLLKGAAGQAVQNMNIMFGEDERTGLLV